jgi:hypothetical protein
MLSSDFEDFDDLDKSDKKSVEVIDKCSNSNDNNQTEGVDVIDNEAQKVDLTKPEKRCNVPYCLFWKQPYLEGRARTACDGPRCKKSLHLKCYQSNILVDN